MQLFSRNKALSVLSLGALVALGACGDDVTVAAPTPAPVTVTITPSNANLLVGSTAQTLGVNVAGGTTTPDFTCTVTPATGVITVAKVAGGCAVTAVAPGTATVIATAGTASAAAQVTVSNPAPAISGIAISPAAINLQVNGTTTISANPTNNPTNATVTRSFQSSNPTVASVGATTGIVTANAPGQATITVTLSAGTGAAAATVTGTAAVTVTANPPAVISVSATPTSATLVTAGTQQITATATYAAGNTGTITYGTNAPGVASVSSTGLITAVGPGAAVITVTASSAGNTSFAAASATQQIPVTVNAPAQVSIANITSGTTNNPVNINNVAGQIQVQLNLVTNNNNVASVALYVCDANVNCTTTAAPAAQQNFGAAGAANGQINLFINTADFTTDFATATAKFLNGQKNLIAVLNVANSNANSNLAILNFNNSDSFAARHTPPSRPGVVSPTTNTTFFGGPDAAGRGRLQIAPVMYTPGRSITSVNVGTTAASCSGTLNFGGTGNPAFPIDYTYGTSIGTATGANATNIVCSTTSASNGSADPDLTAEVNSSIDNAQNAGPMATSAASFATTSSSIPAVTAPASIRVDYALPVMTYALTAPTNGEIGWVNATYAFNTATATDAGVGARAATTFSYFYTGCGTTTTAPAAFTTNTGADIAECGTDFTGGFNTVTSLTRGPYTAWVQGQDLLGNTSVLTSTGLFGVDKTAPAIRYTASTDDNTIYGFATTYPLSAAGDTMFSAQALDERAGFTSTAAQHILARANQALSTGSCVVGTAATTANGGIGSSFITMPNCTNPWGAAPFIGSALTDGYLQISPVTYSGLAAAEGYWSYRARVTDRAGNRTELGNRLALINNTVPAMTGMGIPSVVTAAGPNAFTPNFTEVVEGRLNSFKVAYGADVYAFPAVATHSLWDNIIGANGNTTVNTPFTSGVNFYTNIQSTIAGNAIAATTAATADTVSARPTQVQARVTNVGGVPAAAFFPVNLLDANVQKDDAPWTAATTGKGLNVQSFAVVDNAGETFFSPANGLKARVVANTNVINSPFSRIDYYYRATCASGDWNYVGTVDATQAPATSAVAGANVYIADNGGSRVWTYVLRLSANTNTSLTQFVLSTTTGSGPTLATTAAITSTPAGGYRAIATAGSNGRVLSTQEHCVALPPA